MIYLFLLGRLLNHSNRYCDCPLRCVCSCVCGVPLICPFLGPVYALLYLLICPFLWIDHVPYCPCPDASLCLYLLVPDCRDLCRSLADFCPDLDARDTRHGVSHYEIRDPCFRVDKIRRDAKSPSCTVFRIK